jgi:hypothetical protein
MISELFDPAFWSAWLAGLDRGFVFLLLLPFVVAVVGLWGSYLRDEDQDKARDEERRP